MLDSVQVTVRCFAHMWDKLRRVLALRHALTVRSGATINPNATPARQSKNTMGVFTPVLSSKALISISPIKSGS